MSQNEFPHTVQMIENETPLALKIKGEGLAVSTWVNHFKEVGIQSEEALQHMDRTTLSKLLKKASHSWEKLALHKLLNKFNISERTEQENYLKELRLQLPDPRKYLSETLKQDADGRKMEFDDKPYMTNIDMKRRMRITQKEQSGDQIVERKPLQRFDLIRQIGAGQLLRGQFIHEDLQKSSTYRKQLIQIDEPIELMSPGISETMEILEFDDKKQSDEFDSVLDQCGISFAMGLCGGIPIIAHRDGQASFDYRRTGQRKAMKDWQEQFVNINQILIVPTASFTSSNQNVCLSECALDALKCLHEKFIGNDSTFKKHCTLFFTEFGSHFYTGVWHFGGRYKWAVTSITDSQNKRSENYQKAKVALSGSVGGGVLWFGGEVKGAFENNKDQVTETRTFSEQFKVAKKLEKFGGPQEVDDITLWKKGLAEHNKTWVIIDKDVSHKCYEGVWTLIQGQETTFPSAKDFSSKIQNVWENIYKKTKNDPMMVWSRHQLYLDEKLESSSDNKEDGSQSQRIGSEEHTKAEVDKLLSTGSGIRQFGHAYLMEDSQQTPRRLNQQWKYGSNK